MDCITEKEMEEMMSELDGSSTAASVGASDVAQPPVLASVVPDVPPVPPVSAAPEKVKVGNETMLNRFIDPDEVRRDLAINPTNLDDSMLQHASLYVHYATQTVNARRQYDRLKNAFEILEARLDGEIRSAAADGGKKITEAGIKSQMVADKRWSGGQAKVIDAGSIYRYCEVVENAFCQRKDMILEVARDRRKEKEGQLRVLENQDMRERVLGMVAERKAA